MEGTQRIGAVGGIRGAWCAVVGLVAAGLVAPPAAAYVASEPTWVARFQGPGNAQDVSVDPLMVTPDGSSVIVAGTSRPGTQGDYAVASFDARTGALRWAARYDTGGDDFATEAALSPDGRTVVLTGYSDFGGTNRDFLTVAWDASSGQRLWTARYDGPDSRCDYASAVAFSGDGARVVVTGTTCRSAGTDFATVAYDASSGARLWSAVWAGPVSGGDDYPAAVAVSSNGARVVVTGSSRPAGGDFDVATVAYDGASGLQLWSATYAGLGGTSDGGYTVVLSPDGSRAYVGGYASVAPYSIDPLVVAYDTTTGARVWATTVSGEWFSTLVVSPDGGRIFAAGEQLGSTFQDVLVAAFSSAGALQWSATYDGPVSGIDTVNTNHAAVLSPGGSKLVVAAISTSRTWSEGRDAVLLAYEASSGRRLSVTRYDSGAEDYTTGVAVSGDGTRAYVALYPTDPFDMLVVAYEAGPRLSAAPASVDFGRVRVGRTSAAATVTVSNTGPGEASLGTAAVDGGDFVLQRDTCSGRVLAPGASCQLDVAFAPTATGTRTASLRLASDAPGSPLQVALQGQGVQALASVSPASVDFGGVAVGGQSAPATITVTSVGTDVLSVGSLNLSGPHPADFAISADGCSGRALAPGEGCRVEVTFAPRASGLRQAVLSIPTDDPSGLLSVPLAGTGMGVQIDVQPLSVDFGFVRALTVSPPQRVRVSNRGPESRRISSVRLAGGQASSFRVTSDGCSGIQLAAGAGCWVEVVFAPSGGGLREASLVIEVPDDGGSPFGVGLRGVGDGAGPTVTVRGGDGSVLVPGLVELEGTARDDLSGVERVEVSYTLVGVGLGSEVVAELSCEDASALSCSWSAPPPALPGVYSARVRGVDRTGNVGPAARVVVVVV